MKKQKRERTRAAQVQRKPNPDGLAEFLRNPPIKPTKNQNVFLDKTYYEPYCPDDMYANLDFICHEVFFQLSDAELGTLLKMPNWDPFVVVENLCWYHMAQPGHDMLASPDAIIGYLREIATALESDRNECFGRNIKLWFRKANSPIWEVQPWQQKQTLYD